MATKKVFVQKQLPAFVVRMGPPDGWAGNCFGIATATVKHKLVPKGSAAVYGHWLGPIHSESMFFLPNRPFVQHGWVILPDQTVCDPTRWVFEHVSPYIYYGPADHYDEGGNQVRTQLIGIHPPRYSPDDTQFEITKDVLPTSAWRFVEKLLDLFNPNVPIGVVSYNQLHWLGNQSPQRLGYHVVPIYRAFQKLGLKAMIPIDNWMKVERKHKI